MGHFDTHLQRFKILLVNFTRKIQQSFNLVKKIYKYIITL